MTDLIYGQRILLYEHSHNDFLVIQVHIVNGDFPMSIGFGFDGKNKNN